MVIRRVALWLMLLVAADASAKTLCVNPATGNDTNTYAANTGNTDGTGTSCWATLYRAAKGAAPPGAEVSAQAAQAGDTVYVAAGTYTAPGTGLKDVPAFNSANSGTAGNYISFRAVGTVILQLSSSDGATLGCNGEDYVKWVGFTVLEADAPSTPDTGTTVGWDSTGCWLERNIIDGDGNGHNAGDNHTGIRLEACTDCYVGHNTITNVTTCQSGCSLGSPVNAHNGACIQTYQSTNFVIEHNSLSGCGSGIFLKGGPWVAQMDGGDVRYNLAFNIDTTAYVAHAGTPAASGTPTRIYQNIAYNVDSCFRYWFFGDSTNDPANTHFINNTCHSASNGFFFNGTPAGALTHGFAVWNNIVSSVTNGIVSTVSTTWHQDTTEADFEHQVWRSVSGTFGVLNGGSDNISLATWQGGTYNQDAASPAAITTDPLFANPAGGDFRLCTSAGVPHASCSGASPALSHGRVTQSVGGTNGATIAAGAYITGNETIGPEAVSASPATPIRLRLVAGLLDAWPITPGLFASWVMP